MKEDAQIPDCMHSGNATYAVLDPPGEPVTGTPSILYILSRTTTVVAPKNGLHLFQ